MNGRDITVFGLGVAVTASASAALYYWTTRNQPVTVSNETRDEDVNTEEESQRPSNSVCVSDATNEIVDSEDDSQRPSNPVTISNETRDEDVNTEEESQRPSNSVCVSDATNEIVDSEDDSQRPSNPVTVFDETHVKEVITEENQRPLNSGCVFPKAPLEVRRGEERKRPLDLVPPEVSTGEGSQKSLDSASLEVMAGTESQRSTDLDSNELEDDGGNCDSSNVYPNEPPTYPYNQEEPPPYSSNVYPDAEPTYQHNQPPSCFEFDAVILHASHDEVQAKECQKLLEQHAMIGFIDDVILPGTYTINGLCKLFLKCRLVLVFHTKNFKKDGLMDYANQINLKQAVEEADKNNRIIPVLADDEVLSEELSVLQSVSYYDENFSRKMSKLFTHWRNIIP